MNKRVKQRWVKALRSGDYKQGKYSLVSKDGEYCCLGVLCDIEKARNKEAAKSIKIPDRHGFPVGHISPNSPNFCGVSYEHMKKLVTFNDKKRWSFKKIAAYVERYL